MRILFDLIYPGYLRYFDAPVKELARAGHQVEVWFVDDEKQAEGTQALADEPRVLVGGRRPRAEPDVHYALRAVRSTGDYLRYLDPAFADASYLRRRAARKLPFGLRWLRHLQTTPAWVARRLVAASLRLDRAARVSPALTAFVRDRAPDVVVAGPGVYIGGPQAGLLEAARSIGVPTVVAVASWDNLTTKGLLRGDPDRVLVWNEALADEAVRLHRVRRSALRVTGAPGFDKWFGRTPTRDRQAFAKRVGLDAEQPYVLFVGSTQSISAPDAEIAFVRAWVAALRASGDAILQGLAVLVRPHPYNSLGWEHADLSDLPGCSVWPPGGANPVDDADRADYFDSIHHAAAVVGINTSAMVEAAIVGRPVLTITPPEFADTQTGTLHFKHLLPESGGFLRCASSLDEHLRQLAEVLRTESETQEQLQAFVASFIRPLGRERPATDAFVSEVLAAAAALPAQRPAAGAALRAAMRMLGRIGWFEQALGPRRLSTRLTSRAASDRARLEGLAARAGGARLASPIARAGELWPSSLERLAHRVYQPRRRPAEDYRGGGAVDPGGDELEVDA